MSCGDVPGLRTDRVGSRLGDARSAFEFERCSLTCLLGEQDVDGLGAPESRLRNEDVVLGLGDLL